MGWQKGHRRGAQRAFQPTRSRSVDGVDDTKVDGVDGGAGRSDME